MRLFLSLLAALLAVTVALTMRDKTAEPENSTVSGRQEAREVTCPDPPDIFPCTCTNTSTLKMDCSQVVDEEQLAAVFSAFFPSTSFESLTIAHNDYLTTLPAGVFGNVTFEKFSIHDNSALEIIEPGALLASQSTAVRMQLQMNELASFPFDDLPSFSNLELLDLSGNQLQRVNVLTSSTLEVLHLNRNPLNEVAVDTFKALPALTDLYLSETNLKQLVPGTFTNLPRLHMVALYRNQLEVLEAGTVQFPNDEGILLASLNQLTSVAVNAITGMTQGTVEVQGNNLTELPEQVWRPLLEEGVNLSPYDNPLTCGCDIAWLLNTSFIGQIEPMLTSCADGTLVVYLDPADYADC